MFRDMVVLTLLLFPTLLFSSTRLMVEIRKLLIVLELLTNRKCYVIHENNIWADPHQGLNGTTKHPDGCFRFPTTSRCCKSV